MEGLEVEGVALPLLDRRARLEPDALADLVGRRLAGQAEGAVFGWWNGASKLNLALAAGLALPLLEWLGYAPGRRDPAAQQALGLA